MLPQTVRKIFIIMLLTLGITNFSLNSSAKAEEVLKIGGTGSVLGAMKLLGTAFEKSHPGIKVAVLPSIGSSGGIKAVSKGAIDIGLISRPLTEEELKLGLLLIDCAKSPLVFVTQNDTNKSGLNTEEFLKIIRGEMLTWPNGKRIRLILRPAQDSHTLILKAMSPEISKAMEDALSRGGRLVALTIQESADRIEETPGGFGFSTLSQLITEKRKLKILAYNGVTPSINTLADGSYPVFEQFKLVIKPAPSARVRQFIDFVRSPAGRKILEASGNLVIIDKNGS